MQLVDANDVVIRLRNFVEAEQRALSSQGGKALRLATATQRLELRRRAEKDKEYWERMARVVGATTTTKNEACASFLNRGWFGI
jgi:hypothetical protein